MYRATAQIVSPIPMISAGPARAESARPSTASAIVIAVSSGATARTTSRTNVTAVESLPRRLTTETPTSMAGTRASTEWKVSAAAMSAAPSSANLRAVPRATKRQDLAPRSCGAGGPSDC